MCSTPHTVVPLSLTLPSLCYRLLIDFTTHKDEASWKGYVYAILMFAVPLTQSILEHQHFHIVFRIGMQIRTAIIAAVYRKVCQRMGAVGSIVKGRLADVAWVRFV